MHWKHFFVSFTINSNSTPILYYISIFLSSRQGFRTRKHCFNTFHFTAYNIFGKLVALFNSTNKLHKAINQMARCFVILFFGCKHVFIVIYYFCFIAITNKIFCITNYISLKSISYSSRISISDLYYLRLIISISFLAFGLTAKWAAVIL